MKVDLYKLAAKSDKIRISIKNDFRNYVKNKLKTKFGTLKQASKELNINFITFQGWWLGKRDPIFKNWLDLCKKLNISEEKCFENIESFHSSSKKYFVTFPRFRNIDKDLLVEGVGLYIAEGATSKKTNEISLSNTNFDVLKFYIKWLNHCFNVKDLNIYIYSHNKDFNKNELIKRSLKNLNVPKINRVYYYKKSKQECGLIVCSNAILRYLLNELIIEAKNLTKNNKKLAYAYLRGILAGEGHVYISKKQDQHHIEVGLKNKEEIKFIMDLLNLLDIKFSKKEKTDFTKLTICYKKNLEKLINNGGFGSNKQRTAKLIKAYNLYKH